MKYTLLVIGKIKESWMRAGIDEYIKRLKPMVTVKIIEENEEKISPTDGASLKERRMNQEGEKLLRHVRPDDCVILLDTKGKELASEDLAEWIQNKMVGGIGDFYFVIGGPYGNGKVLQERANLKLSMGPMTLTHQMARLVLVEQLYRAMKINRHEPYHL